MSNFGLTLAGSPREMGKAHGVLMKEKANKFIDSVWDYLLEQVVSTAVTSLAV